jgi:hypothetical protein
MLSAAAIVDLQDERTRAWHAHSQNLQASEEALRIPTAATESQWQAELLRLVELEHRANFDLWHIEDEARAPGATDSELADVKRRVDRTNQLRNDRAEDIDRLLLEWLEPRSLPHPDATLHSESPGLIVDRLSILALKIFHTREEAERSEAPAGHEQRNRQRLAILEEQRADLAQCLDALWRETLQGTRRFKLYLQLKMYNDPALNPAVYGKLARIEAS